MPAKKEKKVVAPAEPVLDSPEDVEAAKLDKEIDNETAAPAGTPTGSKNTAQVGAVSVKEVDGVKSITPTGRFEAVECLIFNEFGVHAGTEPTPTDAARKASSFNTTRKFRN